MLVRRLVYVWLFIQTFFLPLSVPAQSETQAERIAAKPAADSLAALGKRLFFDARLSGDEKISCSSCHQPDQAFTDRLPVAKGVEGKFGTRNTPSLLNVAGAAPFFWDGRRPTLENQVLDPIFNPQEHGLKNERELLRIVGGDAEYAKSFAAALPRDGSAVDAENIRAALAAYLRTLRSADSRFDRFIAGGALNDRERSGFALFTGRARCAECHRIDRHAALTDNRFHNRGVGMEMLADKLSGYVLRVHALPPAERERLMATDAAVAALGRFVVTGRPADIGKFKTPSLRNAAMTAPYMHDGSIATLAAAVDYEVYYRDIASEQTTNLTPQEQADIVEFLKALTDVRYEKAESAEK
jgi:cytochrome c peroxidase